MVAKTHVWLFVVPWSVAHQVSLSMGFPRQEYWSGMPLPSLLYQATMGHYFPFFLPLSCSQTWTPWSPWQHWTHSRNHPNCIIFPLSEIQKSQSTSTLTGRSPNRANFWVIKYNSRLHKFQLRNTSDQNWTCKKFFQQSLKTGIQKGKCHHLMMEGIPLLVIMILNLTVRKISEKNMLICSVQERFNWLLSDFM